MNRNVIWTAVIAVGLMLSMSVVASSAFTTMQLDRDANIDVVNDQNGIIALQAHPDSDVANGTDSGALQIDFDQNNNGAGVNVNSTYTVGDKTDAQNSYAFNITNQNTGALDLNINYTLTNSVSDGSTVKFQVYNSTTNLGTVTPGTPITETMEPNDTLYVVIEVEGGTASTDDLSGTLTISV
ncbi:MAG: hypothetical protein V5A38_09490 [Halolamina sp.]|uniref:hypothetical protein n=1 Tax=Halolamina sp. TaxID=1940283 RepID=UPI002FC27F2C